MASGDSLLIFSAQSGAAPGATFASIDELIGGSTPAETVPVSGFDDNIQEYVDFYGVMPEHYGGGGITLTLMFSAAQAAPGVVEWIAAFRRVANDTENLTASHPYAFNTVVATAPSVVGEVAYTDITFTSGADMDNVVAGDYFILRVARDPTPASGVNVSGDASLHKVHVKEP